MASQAGPLAAVAEETGLALLAADEDLAWHHLDALISAALAAVARPAAGGGATPVGDLFALANAIAAMVGGATAIEDPYLHVLAYSTLPGQSIDEHRRQGILGLQVPYVPVNEAQYRELGRATGVCRFTAGPGSLPGWPSRCGRAPSCLDRSGWWTPTAPWSPVPSRR